MNTHHFLKTLTILMVLNGLNCKAKPDTTSEQKNTSITLSMFSSSLIQSSMQTPGILSSNNDPKFEEKIVESLSGINHQNNLSFSGQSTSEDTLAILGGFYGYLLPDLKAESSEDYRSIAKTLLSITAYNWPSNDTNLLANSIKTSIKKLEESQSPSHTDVYQLMEHLDQDLQIESSSKRRSGYMMVGMWTASVLRDAIDEQYDNTEAHLIMSDMLQQLLKLDATSSKSDLLIAGHMKNLSRTLSTGQDIGQILISVQNILSVNNDL